VHDHSKLDRDLQLAPGELEDALRFACLVAAITCARAGAEPPFRAEIERHAPGSS
jgi:sugar/nucleoside kinase (ribokinase family)